MPPPDPQLCQRGWIAAAKRRLQGFRRYFGGLERIVEVRRDRVIRATRRRRSAAGTPPCLGTQCRLAILLSDHVFHVRLAHGRASSLANLDDLLQPYGFIACATLGIEEAQN